MSKDDYQEIMSLVDGVYQVKYHRLSIQALRNKRSKLLGQIMDLRNKIGSLYEEIELKKSVLTEKQAMLNKLSEDKIKSYVVREQNRIAERNRKANCFLREFIGEERFNILQEKGSFKFKGLDNKEYRIKKSGQLQRSYGKYWYNMCMIQPSRLPLPDIIASVFTAATKVEDGLRGSQRLSGSRNQPERRDTQ